MILIHQYRRIEKSGGEKDDEFENIN